MVLSEQLAGHLGEVPNEPDALVFTTKTGRPLRASNWHAQVWRPAIAKAAVPPEFRPHDLRHFCASVLIRSGASPVLVAKQLGHSSPKVTLEIYSHLFPTDLSEMAERLDDIRSEAVATHSRHVGRDSGARKEDEESETGL